VPALFPIAYFGSIGWFHELVKQREVCFEVCDHFPKQTFRNRCTIVSPAGYKRLTVPVEKPSGNKTLTRDILVSRHGDWRKDHWRALTSAYASSPYFDHYARDIEAIVYGDCTHLVELALKSMNFCLEQFGLEVSYTLSTQYSENEATSEADFRKADFEGPDDRSPGDNYTQVLFGEQRFLPNASVLDLLFCEGPSGRKILANSPI
jgi:hypothetical protein